MHDYKKIYVMSGKEKRQQNAGEVYAAIIMLVAILKFIF